MNFSESCSSSSSKRQENGDMFEETKRPYKKARFSWQVKGKNHVKNRSSDDINKSNTSSARESSSSDPNIVLGNPNLTKKSESDIEILGNYLIKNDFNTDTVITDSEKSVFKPCNDVNKEANEYPRYIAYNDNNGINVPNTLTGMCASSSRITSAMVNQSLILTEDICITRWQARQKARVFADNTINRVLEITNRPWIEPIPANMSRNITQDFAEFINNLPEANTVEDEGILMAISAHGLQYTSSPNIRRGVENIEEIDNNSNVSTTKELMQSSSSSNCDMLETACNIEKYFEKQEMDESAQSLTSDVNGKSKCTGKGSPIRCSSSMSNDFFDDILDDTCSGESFYPYCEIDENITMQTDHYDFMNEAVSFAIQNIGLTSSSTNCG